MNIGDCRVTFTTDNDNVKSTAKALKEHDIKCTSHFVTGILHSKSSIIKYRMIGGYVTTLYIP